MKTESVSLASEADREIISRRVFNHPRERVFAAWSDPKQLAQWWGPKGFTNTFHVFEFKPGGTWDFVMHGPDGTDYPNKSVFSEIVRPERIVFDHISAHGFQVTATFEELDGRTGVTFRMLFQEAAECDKVKQFVVEANEQNFDRLERLFAEETPPAPSGDRELVITRIIDAPRERIFKAWTTELSRWWGPHGMTTPFVEMDLRSGGVFRTIMRAPDGTEYPTQGVFLEVVENERIVFTDAYGPGWEPSADIFFTAITTLEALPGGKTRYTARALHWTVENREKHEQMGFHHGWGESLDRLTALVTENQNKP